MTFRIRNARHDDARAIVRLIELAFKELPDLNRITRCLERDHFTLVAEVDQHQVVGFADGFLTNAQDGTVRLELDLLAVHPQFRRRGIAQQLIDHFVGAYTNARLTRALVAVGNTPMEVALQRAGFHSSRDSSVLYTGSCTGGVVAACPEDAHLVPVSTMTYSGFWLEGHVTPAAITFAQTSCHSEDMLVGAVVPEKDVAAIQALETAALTRVKTYCWWHRSD